MGLLVKNLLFTVVLPGTVAIYVPLWLARGHTPAGGVAALPGLLCYGAGAAVYAWTVWDFASFGRGTPAPIDAPKRLVVRGLYRVTRNPMYVGVLTVILGHVLCFRTLELGLYGVAAWTAFQLFVVLYEEPALRRQFGAEYEAYRERVGRWLPRGRAAG